MKTSLKYLTITGLVLTGLTWSPLKVKAQEVEVEREATEDIGAREAYRRLQLQDENGQIPPDAWTNAYAEKNQMPFLPEAWSEFSSAAQIEAGIQGGVWVSIGPGNIGGRIRSIVIHPGNPAIMWAGGVSGGIWKTTNGGGSWTTNTDSLANLAVSCMVMDPTDHNILYAGTGEGFLNHDALRGNGIFKTIDGGVHWTPLPATNNANFYFVNRLAISPWNPQHLLAATAAGIFRSTDGGVQWFPGVGLPGVAWGDVRYQPRPPSIPGQVEIPDVVEIYCLAGSLDGRIYYSINDGAGWQASDGSLFNPAYLARVELAYSRSNPWIVYASVGAAGNHPSWLFHSQNGGITFVPLGHPQDPTNPNLGGANWYANTLWVDPTDPNTIVVGGYYLPLLRTRDRAHNWEQVWRGSHPDQHVIVEHPDYTGASGNNKIVYLGSDGGIHRTEDILATITPPPPGGSVLWESRNHSLGVTQFYGGAGHVATGSIIGGTQDNGTVRLHPSGGPENWDTMVYGDGGFCAVDQNTDPYFYGEYINLQIYRNTTNQGSKLYYIWGGPGHPNGIPAECGDGPCANFTAPFVLDPNNTLQTHRMLAGGRSLWRSTNARAENSLAVAWSPIKGPMPPNCTPDTCININAAAVAEGFSDLIWVGYNDGSVSYTTDGTSATPSWSPGDPNNLLPGGPNDQRFCTRITIGPGPNPSNPQIAVARTVYVTFGGFFPSTMDTRGNVWKRESDGVTWTDIHHNLPSTPIYSLVISPTNPDILYIGTEVGVFASSNGGQTWSPAFGGSSSDTLIYSLVVSASAPSDPDIVYVGTEDGVFASKDGGATWSPGFGGPANTRVAELFWMGPKLVVATHGRGMFTLSPPSP
jgi:photosystem II stability/assembly factor-like uncharacterized protein